MAPKTATLTPRHTQTHQLPLPLSSLRFPFGEGMPSKLAPIVLAIAVIGAACGGASQEPIEAADSTEPSTTVATSTTVAQGPVPTEPAPPIDDLATKPVIVIPDTDPPPDLVIVDRIVGDGDEAVAGSLVTVQYVGVRYSDGGQFDASWDRDQAFEFELGARRVIAGWDRGVEGMRVGGRRELIIPAPLAYGDRSPSEEIPSGSALIFVVDLVSVVPPAPSFAEPTTGADGVVTIENQGGNFEGNLPWTTDGAGPGLFAGDNLSSEFPNDEGLAIYLAFSLAEVAEIDAGLAIVRATLTSTALQVAGTPFEDLGALSAAPVDYEVFPPTIEEREPTLEPVACEANIDQATLTCDVTAALTAAAESGDDQINLTLKFAEASDGDGEPDIAVFFFTDPNTNDRGIFSLAIEFGEPPE